MKQNVTLTLIILFTLGLFSCKKEEVPEKSGDPTPAAAYILEPELYYHRGDAVVTFFTNTTSANDDVTYGIQARSTDGDYPVIVTPLVWNDDLKRFQATLTIPVNLTQGDSVLCKIFSSTDSSGFERLEYIPKSDQWENFTFLPGLGEAYYVVPAMTEKDSVQLKIGEINMFPDSAGIHALGVNYSDKEQSISLKAFINDTLVDADSIKVTSGLFDHYFSLEGFTPNTPVKFVLQVNQLELTETVMTPKVTYSKLSFSFNGLDSVVVPAFTKDFVIGTLTGYADGPVRLSETIFMMDTTGTADSTNPSDYCIEVEGVTTWSPDDWTKSNPLWSVNAKDTRVFAKGYFSIPVRVKTSKTFLAPYRSKISIRMLDIDKVELRPTSTITGIFK